MYKYKDDLQDVNLGAGFFGDYFITEVELRKLKLKKLKKLG